jgi:hypothetical protein
MKNKLRRSVSGSTNPLAKDITFPGESGVFGAHPAPGFRDYPETKGKVLPLTKKQETDISRSTKTNAMKRSVVTKSIPEAMGLQQPGTSRIIKGRNRYETTVKSSNTGKKGL